MSFFIWIIWISYKIDLGFIEKKIEKMFMEFLDRGPAIHKPGGQIFG